MKLNRKGYMTIEIILAAVVTFVIAFFLIDITMKLSSNTDDAYIDTVLITDKTLVTKNIKKLLEEDMARNGDIKSVNCEEGKSCTITMDNNKTSTVAVNENTITYKDSSGNDAYSKKIAGSLTNISISGGMSENNDYCALKITGENIFTNNDYDMKVIVYSKTIPILLPKDDWYKSATPKSNITKITFIDEYESSNIEDESWSVGANLTCYRIGTELIIAGNGTGVIYANSDSRWMLSDEDEMKKDSSERQENKFFINLVEIEGLNLLNTSLVENMTCMFMYCRNILSLDVSGFDTSNVISMKGMFAYCEKISTLQVDTFDTSNVTDMGWMFSWCYQLKNVNLSNFKTDNVKSMRAMFQYCEQLEELDVRNFNTSSVTFINHMFAFCKSLTSIDVTNFDTSNVITMSSMFSECRMLTSIDLNNFNTEKVTDMGHMFSGCESLILIDVTSFDTSNVTNMEMMFSTSEKLEEINFGDGFVTDKVEKMGGMFSWSSGLRTLDLSSFNVTNVTDFSIKKTIEYANGVQREELIGMFWECNSLETIYVSDKWGDTSKAKVSDNMFFGCTKLVGGAGTIYTADFIDKTYARIDDPDNNKSGYLTLIES